MNKDRARLGVRLLVVGLMSAVLVGVANEAYAVPASASRNSHSTAVSTQAPAVAGGSYRCGWFTCSYVFSRRVTVDIATGSAGLAVCASVPTPGNIFCGIGLGSLVFTANIAKNRNECVVINFTRTPPPLGTWWPSTDNGSRCRDN
jgi:hypothetical protein